MEDQVERLHRRLEANLPQLLDRLEQVADVPGWKVHRVTNPEDAIDRVETVIRSRIDEFGVAEPLIQKVGTDRLIIQLPGISDPARAKQIIERSAFLEFRITDMQGQFEASLERIDRALERAGVVVGDEAEMRAAARSAIDQILGAAADTTTQSADSFCRSLTNCGVICERSSSWISR